MTRQLAVKTQAKVNLTFDIVSLLPDGYHEVATLMQAIDLGDNLTFAFTRGAFNVDIMLREGQDKKQFPLDDSNLIYKAAYAFFKKCPQLEPLSIRVDVEKNIPIAAGLAGGSSNAAATLMALNEFYGQPLAGEELQDLARTLGADVPFCVAGGIAVGLGRGDLLKSVESSMPLNFCLVKPKNIALSTPWVYKQYDIYLAEKSGGIRRPNLENAVGAISFGELESAIEAFGNVFEPVVYAHYPELAELKQMLQSYGCPYVQLTGSGPTIFALTSDLEMAHFVRSKLKARSEADKLDILLASSVKNGLKVLG
ncbi:MAG: 4-(cytidine 5'-diphospho)-2-C-methyl-D-erythritol kinase [Candidatus Obscuribacterales bacterium]|nr:4-(cytidine 5'-diphospho)-2-C-methyl-D-erythritol kinase [Candidatus Obscuribacterales bacterium]